MTDTATKTLEERIAALELQVTELRRLLMQQRAQKNWRSTVGMFDNDAAFKEAAELGRQWREDENRRSLEEL